MSFSASRICSAMSTGLRWLPSALAGTQGRLQGVRDSRQFLWCAGSRMQQACHGDGLQPSRAGSLRTCTAVLLAPTAQHPGAPSLKADTAISGLSGSSYGSSMPVKFLIRPARACRGGEREQHGRLSRMLRGSAFGSSSAAGTQSSQHRVPMDTYLLAHAHPLMEPQLPPRPTFL